MRLLELFSGTGSVGKAAKELGWDVFSVDSDPQHGADFTGDILGFMPEGEFDIVWASPPCTTFSVASMGHHWGQPYGTPKTPEALVGIQLLERTLELIHWVEPIVYAFENPRGMMRKMPQVQGYPRQTVTYCAYGDTRMKPTDIWTNCEWEPRPMCKNGDTCHDAAPRGSRTGTQGLKGAVERGRIPNALVMEILVCAEQQIRAQGNQQRMFA